MSGQSQIPAPMQKTIDYCQKFAKFTAKKAIKDIRPLFPEDDSKKYSQFELAQIVNLCLESAEEAFVLIPSLVGRNEDELQNLLNDLQNLKRTQGA